MSDANPFVILISSCMQIKSLTKVLFLVFLFNLGCKKDPEPVESPAISLKTVRFWAYQIDGLEDPSSIDSICSSHYDLIVMDQQRSISGSEDYPTQNDIQRIHNSSNSSGGKKLAVCYIDVGQAESYRYYWQNGWQSGNPSWILEPDPDGWNDSYGVKYWSPEWKSIMKQYIGRIIEDGYDGVYLDWLMIYETPDIISAAQHEGLDPKEELISFIRDLATFSRMIKPGFLFIAQNGAEMGDFPEYVALFDAIAQEDIWYDGSGDPDNGGNQGDWPVDPLDSQDYIEELVKWQQQDKPVLDVEYAQLPDHVARAYQLGSQHNFVTYTTLRLLDKLSGTPPPGY
jgi:cysteinyl-tRNA synthetase, unknown class